MVSTILFDSLCAGTVRELGQVNVDALQPSQVRALAYESNDVVPFIDEEPAEVAPHVAVGPGHQ